MGTQGKEGAVVDGTSRQELEQTLQTTQVTLIHQISQVVDMDKPTRTTADQIVEGGDSPDELDNQVPKMDNYGALLNAVLKDDWNATRKFLEQNPHALTARRTTFLGGTVLFSAIDAGHEKIVVQLVDMISEPDLLLQDNFGNTALHVVSIYGSCRMAECLIKKNKSLVSIKNRDKELPVVMAMSMGPKEVARYLYSQTPMQDLEAEQGCQGASVLNYAICNKDLGTALDLMERCPRLALGLDERDISPLVVLATSTEAFESGKGMVFWKQWIYDHCIHIRCDRDNDKSALNIQNDQEEPIGSVGALRWRQLVSSLLNLLGFKLLYEMKLVRDQFRQLLACMCKVISTDAWQDRQFYDIIWSAIFQAISIGNFEFIYEIVKADPNLLWIADISSERRSIFHWVVLYRQHRIFNLIYNTRQINALLSSVDNSRNTILHMAGMLTEHSSTTSIENIRGAALQMQREVQWFKEVEYICPRSCRERLNKQRLTPRQLFTRDHQKLRKEGEKWMKGTATSCTVVGTLIITIMFAAAFTIPGGNNQDTGLPILLHDKLFTLFIVTDFLSLFSSSTSVLMFLGILTSRYAEEDFLISLPRKMIIGLFALFFSIATMMIAFSATLLLMLRGKYWIVVPIISLAGVPIILFVLMQFRLLVDMLVSTYGSGIFNRKMKPWL